MHSMILLLLITYSHQCTLFEKLPKNSDIVVWTDNSKMISPFKKCSIQPLDVYCEPWDATISIISINRGISDKVVESLEKSHKEISSYTFMSLVLDMSNSSDTFEILHEISKFYSDEARLRRPLTVFILTYSSDENGLLKLEMSRKPVQLQWQISVFIVELDALNEIASVLELVTFSTMTYTRHISLREIEPDFFETILSRESRENLHGSIVRALAIDIPDERYSAEFNKNGSRLTFFEGGYTVSLLYDLRDALNFSVVAVAGNEYITDQSANNTVGGIGAQLVTNEADLIISMSYALEFRVKYLSPTVAFNADRVMVFFRQPSLFLNRNVFLHPFQDIVWMTLFCILGLIAISIFVVTKIQYFVGLKKHPTRQYFWILGAMCQKSCSCAPRRLPGRIILIMTFFMGWIIYTFYSASIISRLSVSYNPITTLTGLVSSGFNLLADPLVSYSKFLQFAANQDWEKTFVSEIDSVSKIFNGGYGFISSIDLVVIASRNLGFSEQSICDTLSSISLHEIVMPLQFFTRKGYPFKELVNRKLLNSMGKGFNHRYRAEFLWHTNPVCPEMTQTTFENLGFPDLYSAFVGLALAYILVFGILVTEKVIYRFRVRSKVGKCELPSIKKVRKLHT